MLPMVRRRRRQIFTLFLTLAACNGDDLVRPPAGIRAGDVSLGKWSDEASVPSRTAVRAIGPAGGQIALGPVTLIVPTDAVEQETEFFVEIPARDGGLFVAGPRIQSLKRAVKVQLDMSHTTTPGSQALLARYHDGRWEPLDTKYVEHELAETLIYESTIVATIPCIPVEDPEQQGCREPVPDLCSECNGLWVNGWSAAQCFGSANPMFQDSDHDSLDDWCERDLAFAFRPRLNHMMDCSWDDPLNRAGAEYLYLVQPLSANHIRIVYLLGYYVDCGNGTYGPLSFGHSGDSEFVAFDVEFVGSTNHWVSVLAFYSAHCGAGAPWQNYCGYYPPADLLWEDGKALGAAQVYVARGKHANYPRVDLCHAWNNLTEDECGNGYSYRFPMGGMWHTTGNIGSRAHPLIDVTGPISHSAVPDSGVVESIWATPFPYVNFSYGSCIVHYPRHICRFNGWKQAEWGAAPKPYGWLLLTYLGL